MSKSIELEYKTLLTLDQFNALIVHFNLQTQDPLVQTNTYYDRTDQILLQHNAAFRLRNFPDSAEWTIKQRVDSLKSIELTESLNTPLIPPKHLSNTTITNSDIHTFVTDILEDWSQLVITYQMTTHRWTIPFYGGELCLDRTNFGSTTDFELEFEFNHIDDEKYWIALLGEFEIEYKLADKKIARAKSYASITN